MNLKFSPEWVVKFVACEGLSLDSLSDAVS